MRCLAQVRYQQQSGKLPKGDAAQGIPVPVAFIPPPKIFAGLSSPMGSYRSAFEKQVRNDARTMLSTERSGFKKVLPEQIKKRLLLSILRHDPA